MNNIKKLENEIAQKTKELEQLKLQQQLEQQLSPEQQFAITLHEKCCKYNHTDGCSWFYEVKNNIHDWNGYHHTRYLQHSRKTLKFANENNIGVEKIVEIIDLVKYF